MYLIKLDANNVVIAIELVQDVLGVPMLTPLDPTYLLTVEAPVMGQTFDPAAKTFTGPPRRRWITNLAFDNRFTVDERVNIELAAMVEPGMTVEQRRQAMALRVDLDRAKKATYIDLDRADTQAGVQQFETFGLIGAGRAAVILADPIESHEYFSEA